MNSLSWLIYAAEVLGNVRGLFIGCTILSIAGLAIGVISAGVDADFGGPKGEWKRIIRGYAWVPFVFAVLATVLPTSQTIYLIAASEAGEAVVTNPDTIEMMGDLKAIIKKRLKEELGE